MFLYTPSQPNMRDVRCQCCGWFNPFLIKSILMKPPVFGGTMQSAGEWWKLAGEKHEKHEKKWKSFFASLFLWSSKCSWERLRFFASLSTQTQITKSLLRFFIFISVSFLCVKQALLKSNQMAKKLSSADCHEAYSTIMNVFQSNYRTF